MKINQYKNIIFDFDRTLATLLIDWSTWQSGVESIIKKYDSNFNDTESIRSHLIAKFVDTYGKEFLKDYVEFGKKLEREKYSGYEPINKTISLLKEAKQKNKKIYLLTSNSFETVVPILEELKIDDYFNKIISSENVKNLKPNPAAFELIYEEGSNKKEYLMIGDSLSDSGFAKNVGIGYLDVKDF